MAQNGRTIVLHRRPYRFIEKKLIDAGASNKRANELTNRTSGLFYPLLSKITDGLSPMYDNFQSYSEEIKVLMLIGGFNKGSQGDIDTITSLYSGTFEHFMSISELLTKTENPILTKKTSYGKTAYLVACVSALWCRFPNLVETDDLITFCKQEKKVWADFIKNKGYKGNGSSFSLFSSSIDSLKFVAAKTDATNESIISRLVSDFLDQSLVDGSIKGVLQYSRDFLELSPSTFLSFLSTNKEEIGQLAFENVDNDQLGSIEPQTFPLITGALVIALRMDGWARVAVKLLSYFASIFVYSGNIGPTPTSALSEFFAPVFSISRISEKSKEQIVSEEYSSYPNTIIPVIKNALLCYSIGIAEFDSYRTINDDLSVSTQEATTYKTFLFDFFLNHCSKEDNYEVLNRLSSFWPNDAQITLLLSHIGDSIGGEDDNEKERHANKLRAFLYDSRFFDRPFIRNKDSLLDKAEQILSGLKYKNPIFQFLYLFERNDYDFPLIHPAKYVSPSHQEEEKNLQIQERKNGFSIMQNEGILLSNVLKLLKKRNRQDDGYLGKTLSLWTLNGRFSQNDFLTIERNGFPIAAFDYANHLLDKTELSKLIDISSDPKTRGLLLLENPTPDASFYKQLNQEKREVKVSYWQYARLTFTNRSDLEAAIDSANSVDDAKATLSLINDNVALLNPIDVPKLLLSCLNKIDGGQNTMYAYEISQSLKALQGRIESNDDALQTAAIVEAIIARNNTYYGYCFNIECCQKIPEYYVSLVSLLHMEKKKETSEKDDKVFQSFAFDLLWNLHFCPGEANGSVPKDSFLDWIARFSAEMTKNGLTKSIDDTIGKLLAYSPIGDDGVALATPVREYLEKASKEAINSFIIAEFNKRGVFSPENGEPSLKLAQKYSLQSKLLQEKGFPGCSKIFQNIASSYFEEAKDERSDSCYGK